MATRIDMSDKDYGFLTVLEYAFTKNKYAYWKCRCNLCGIEKIINGQALRRGTSISCGCYARTHNQKLAAIGASNKNKKDDNYSAIHSLYTGYKRHAKERSLVFDLTKENFVKIIQLNCYYCGSDPSNFMRPSNYYANKNDTGSFKYNGIDRIDNDFGYFDWNCVPCCFICNRAKNKMDFSEFKSWIDSVYKTLNEKETT